MFFSLVTPVVHLPGSRFVLGSGSVAGDQGGNAGVATCVRVDVKIQLFTLYTPQKTQLMIKLISLSSFYKGSLWKNNMESKKLEVDGSDDFPFHRCDFQLPAVSFGGWLSMQEGDENHIPKPFEQGGGWTPSAFTILLAPLSMGTMCILVPSS